MGGTDKGLKRLRGRFLVEWVIERFAPQVDEVLINANQNLPTYRALGYPVIPDEIAGFAGPLAGLQCGLAHAHHDFVATVPCDSPFLPPDLIPRLRAALERKDAEVAVARTGDQPHPVFCLCRRSVLPGLTRYLAAGGRKIDAWYEALRIAEVAFDDEPRAFSNINTLDELSLFEADGAPE
jgi:molybdenum cofactor guanylyltransferase